MNDTTENAQQEYKPGDPLTKMEVCHLFCRELRISQTTYFDHYRPLIKFRSYGSYDKKVMRMPYNVAMGLINQIRETPQPSDPPAERLQQFKQTQKVNQ